MVEFLDHKMEVLRSLLLLDSDTATEKEREGEELGLEEDSVLEA